MKVQSLLPFIVAGLFFGIWPYVAKKAFLPPLVQAFIVAAVTTAFIGPFTKVSEYKSVTVLALGLLVLAGVLNGFGQASMFKGISSADDKTLPYGLLIMQIVMMSVYWTCGNLIFAHNHVGLKQVAGMFLLMATAALLSL